MRRVVVLVALAACWSGDPPAPPPVIVAPVHHTSPAPREDRFDQSSPRAALVSFIRAVDRDRYDVMVRFIPTRFRERVTEASLRERKAELVDAIAKVRPHVDDAYVEDGDAARLEYGGGQSVKFVREDGVWRIADFD